MNTALVNEVRRGYARGWRFTPLRGKVPIMHGWQSAPPASLEQSIAWAKAGNVGLRTGMVNRVAIIDIDQGAPVRMIDFPATLTAVTGSGGYHLYYHIDRPVKNSVGQIAPKVDVRGDGGQVVFVGSIHPNAGRPYRWLCSVSPIVEFPYDLLPKPKPPEERTMQPITGSATKYAAVSLAKACDRVARAQEGTRHNTLYAQAADIGSFVWAGWLSFDDAARSLIAAALQSGLPEHDARRTTRDALRWGMEHPTDYIRAKAMDEQLEEITVF